MYVQAIVDGDSSSAYTTMIGLAKYSKHKIDVLCWNPNLDKKPDIVYFHFGALIQDYEKIVVEHRETKWVCGVLGPSCLGKMGGDFYKYVDGIIALGTVFTKHTQTKFPTTPVYTTDVGVDTGVFIRQPPPKYFSVGMAENNLSACTNPDMVRFWNYPYAKKTSIEGLGTFREFSKMAAFYKEISVLVDNADWARPGGLMFLEAGAVGRPVICMRTGVTADWLPTEWLATDDVDVEGMLNVLHNDEYIYKEASDTYYKIAKSRDYSVIVKEYDDAFDQILSEPYKY